MAGDLIIFLLFYLWTTYQSVAGSGKNKILCAGLRQHNTNKINWIYEMSKFNRITQRKSQCTVGKTDFALMLIGPYANTGSISSDDSD